MYKKFIILLLLFFVGAVSTSAFTNVEQGLNKNCIFSLGEDNSEGNTNTDEFLKSLPEFDGKDRPAIVALLPRNSNCYLKGLLSFGRHLLQSDRVIRKSLFLLYHSLLFYELA